MKGWVRPTRYTDCCPHAQLQYPTLLPEYCRKSHYGKEASGQQAVSKTVIPKGTAGSNPVFSAVWAGSIIGECTSFAMRKIGFDSLRVHCSK